MIRVLLIIGCFVLSGRSVLGQQSAAVIDYINRYRQLAIDEMQRTGVPASIKLAQGIHETEAGRSELVLKSNNHFGIKCKTGWSGEKVYHDDDANGECFRSYNSPEDSYRDHSDFLKSSQRYASLFQLDPTNYKGWAYGLKKAGYATNIKYSQILIKLIETYSLQQYTLIAMGKLPPISDMMAGEVNTPTKNEAVLVVPVVNYPEGVFQVNDTRVVFVKGGTSLLAIANQYDVALARLLDFNDMTAGEGDILNEDQLVFLQRKRKTGANLFHHVQPEETLYDIAQYEGIRYEALLELNHLQPGMQPAVGERIFLKEKSPARPVLMDAPVRIDFARGQDTVETINTAALTRHIVLQKETLYGIGKKYGVSPDKIKEWNRLSSAPLKPGQELIIYPN
ncbi:glucosaminidase domain-containing protein [Flavihumibacter fluvii]|uniref:glucosaminidase domain-containing protein n=1 Tax=Flavihumibacter fluvii TaxID=2838157 RepID=UPI001BDEFC83|nr:glucosaminidase domain-containing protein [Flavihumibacter fluvii]ULQ50674.1 LysM peptidoglycan-binding domain-containing protein [Flavihumibacter fluvii]